MTCLSPVIKDKSGALLRARHYEGVAAELLADEMKRKRLLGI